MSSILYLSQFIAIGQKTGTSASPFGEGHNFMVDVGFELPAPVEEGSLRAGIDAVLKRIDHRALGVDVNLGVEPVTSMLAKWIFDRLQDSGLQNVVEVKLKRGDGMTASYFEQPKEGKSI